MKANARILIFFGAVLLILVAISLYVSFGSFPMHRETMTYADRVELVTGRMEDFEKDVFSGLKEKDPQRIKKHFSKFALENCNDWDAVFEHLFSRFGGSDITFTSHSYATFSDVVNYTPRQDSWYFEAKCLFTANGKHYLMYWQHFITYDPDPDSVGVFAMGIQEDIGFPSPPFFAWGAHPGREHAERCYYSFLTYFTNKKTYKFDRSVKIPDVDLYFTVDVLPQISSESKYYLGWFLVNQDQSKIYRTWIKNVDDGQIVYYEMSVGISVCTLAIHLDLYGQIRGIKIQNGSYKENAGDFTSVPDGIHGFDAKFYEDAVSFGEPPTYVEPTVSRRTA